jgi:hypothetical protein
LFYTTAYINQEGAMWKTNKRYLNILDAELKDLEEDIKLKINKCKEERECERISNYVYMENIALFKNELNGINAFSKIIGETDPRLHDDIEELVSHLTKRFKEEMKSHGLAEAVKICVEIKMDMVAKYIANN